jgi:cytidylate kinase
MRPLAMLIATIDGPTASGKTTVAQAVAQLHGLFHLRGGTFLRAFAYFALKSGVDHGSQEQLKTLLRNFRLDVIDDSSRSQYIILVNGDPVQGYLWTPEVDAIVSSTSRPVFVREARVAWKNSFAAGRRLIADGRTLGSEVFPAANLKIHLTSSLEQRAKRRYLQYLSRGISNVSFSDIKDSIANRDASDAQGELDRTLVYPDQHVIDSTDQTIDQVVCQISSLIKWLEK